MAGPVQLYEAPAWPCAVSEMVSPTQYGPELLTKGGRMSQSVSPGPLLGTFENVTVVEPDEYLVITMR